MDLLSENPYWLLKNGLINTYPSLQHNINTDIAIIGAGITGALTAWYLCRAGFDVTIVDRRHIAMGSTSACTGLLQYEIDTPLVDLCKRVGESNATRSYELCREALYTLEKISRDLPIDCEFLQQPSLQYASYKKHITSLYKEYTFRKERNFQVHWLERDEIKKLFGFEAPAGILSEDGATVNAYLLTHGLFKTAANSGARVFDNTLITDIQFNKNNTVLTADNTCTITANKLIIASGYESQRYLPKPMATWLSTYAIISEPLYTEIVWHKNAMIWETATPYLYLRITGDKRILVGGLDDEFYNPSKRDDSLGKKARLLQSRFHKLFPHIPFKTDFKWAGTFANTKDGLPYIGTAGLPNTYFALGYGGNGVVFSVVAAQIITDAMLGKKNSDTAIFSFNR